MSSITDWELIHPSDTPEPEPLPELDPLQEWKQDSSSDNMPERYHLWDTDPQWREKMATMATETTQTVVDLVPVSVEEDPKEDPKEAMSASQLPSQLSSQLSSPTPTLSVSPFSVITLPMHNQDPRDGSVAIALGLFAMVVLVGAVFWRRRWR
jgi:MYXO-CTERM domain-containing protein